MAAEFVGGALLSAFIQTAVDRLASPQVVDFFRGRKLDEKLLNRLKLKLRSINVVLDDAELKQIQSQLVRDWLFEVKDAVHDAEDLLDEIDYELTRCQVEAELEPQTFLHKVPKFFKTSFSSFNWKIDSIMKEVLEKLEDLVNQKDDLGLKETTYSEVGSGSKVALKLESTPLVVESGFYGRNDDKDVILKWLTSETETDSHNQLTILSIVGMGGVGKTMLAQHVYNELKMEEADFAIKAWVCVSDEFNVLTVTRAILEIITMSQYDGDLETLHGRLKEELSGKKFLLVLDDVWNEDRDKWEAVQTSLNYGAPGSRVLVTTRSEKVAFTVRSSKVLHLKPLQEKHCWEFFCNLAFQDNRLQLDAELEDIARKIVDKCKGLPLALKTMGSLLGTKSSIMEWESVLMSNIWDFPKDDNKIISALFLSYHHLPSYLKRCFAYCALFPKDYQFDMKDLILLWMAENFLQCPQQSKNPKEVGEQYFYDLLSRSFFQRSTESTFIMHDLLNDLAKYVSGDICFRLGVDKEKSIPKATRHFSIVIGEVEDFDGFGSTYDAAKRLHTFIPASTRGDTHYWPCKISSRKLFSKFKSLRVLSLSHCSTLADLPDSLGKLKHLRSLDLSDTQIEKLPDSTCLLYNLQILKLNFCQNLVELPSKLYKLTNLHCLEFEYTKVRRMPMHLGKLKNLQVLSYFYVGESSEFGIEQLQGLNLHESLSIKKLGNIVNPSNALAANLKNKTHLEKLELEWEIDHIHFDSRKEKKVLDNLQPSKHLKYLSIRNYSGTQFPSWLSNFNVVSLVLISCKYCVVLPPLGNFPFLNTLRIIGLDGIVSIGAEFYGSSSSSFTSLETLYLEDMKVLEEWECQAAAFPRLQYLCISGCPKLKGLSEQLLRVKTVELDSCERLGVSGYGNETTPLERIEHSTSSTSLSIDGSPNMSIPLGLVGGDLLSGLLQVAVDRLDSPQFSDFFSGRNLDEELLIKLKAKLLSIDALADDAEEKQLTDPRVKAWLADVRDAVFDADDLLDEIDYEHYKSQVEAESVCQTFTHKVPSFFATAFTSFNKKIDSGIKQIHAKLESLAIQKDDLGLREAGAGSGGKVSHKLSLNITDCPSMSIPLGFCYDFLVKLKITNSNCLTAFPLDSFPNLCMLLLRECCNLQMISQEHTHNNLKDLFIRECPQFKSFPSEGLSAPSLAEFKLEELENLKLLPKDMHILLPLLTELEIMDCPLVEMFSDGGLPSNIKRVSLSSLKLIASLKGALAANASQQMLSVVRVDVESFPGEGFLPLSLTSLEICHCPNLKKLDYKGLRQLSSLKELRIFDCDNLQCLPEEGLPNSISTLRIIGSKILRKSCEKPGGEDWTKISHIKNLLIS